MNYKASATECKLCTDPASQRLITPFGVANLCTRHATEADVYRTGTQAEKHAAQHGITRELMAAFSYGPRADPPLQNAAKG